MTLRQRLREEAKKKEKGLPNNYEEVRQEYLRMKNPEKDIKVPAVEETEQETTISYEEDVN
jgi:hypothetical protein